MASKKTSVKKKSHLSKSTIEAINKIRKEAAEK